MTSMPILETSRLLIRPFTLADLDSIHRILDLELSATETGSRWLEWTILNYEQLAILNQPPYGDRVIVLKSEHLLIGAVGFVPTLGPFHQLPYFQENPDQTGFEDQASAATLALNRSDLSLGFTPEVGLYYVVSPRFQRQGFAAEAAALVRYAFDPMPDGLHLVRLIATTTYDNLASQAVMRKLGMTIQTKPLPEPPWFQVIRIIENPTLPSPES